MEDERLVCRPTPCPVDGTHVELDEFPGCHELEQQGPCSDGEILERIGALLIECRPLLLLRVQSPHILRVPKRCKPNQYRDRYGKCQDYFYSSVDHEQETPV